MTIKILTWVGLGLGIVGTILSNKAGDMKMKEEIAKEVANAVEKKS